MDLTDPPRSKSRLEYLGFEEYDGGKLSQVINLEMLPQMIRNFHIFMGVESISLPLCDTNIGTRNRSFLLEIR